LLEFVGIVEIVGIVGICWTEVVRLVEIVGICWTEVVGIFYKIKKSAVKRRHLTSSAYTSWQRKYPTDSYRLENQNIRSIVPKTADDGQFLKEYREGAVILCERHIPLMPISVRSSKWSCRVQGAVILNRRYTLTLEDYGTLEIPI
jgi:hypothetical protein